MADADITLDGVECIVEGDLLVVHCLDLKLDAPSRRGTTWGERRALVHGHNDELVVNYADDYPGGVTIRGEVGIPGKVKQNHLRLESHDLHLDHPDRRSSTSGERRALVHGHNDELVVNYAEDYPGGVTIRGEVGIPGKVKQDHLRLESHDLHLDHPDRRSSTSGERRALVHGFNDELVLNWGKDYPGGVVCHGDLEVQKSGSLQMRNTMGDATARLSSRGELTLGGNGASGYFRCKNSAGQEIFHLDAEAKRMNFNDIDRLTKVRIDTDHFTERAWPPWPGERSPSRLDLIVEIRRLKEEVLALRTAVDALVT